MFKKSLLLFAAISLTQTASAALYDRGNGLIYDDVLDITWLQDANYAQTSGYDADGRMTWADANTWAANLSYGGYDDWRLPSILNSTYPDDFGYNITTGELGHMFFNNLGNQSYGETDGACMTHPEYCLKNTSFTDAGTGDTVSFLNVQSSAYWYSEVFPLNSDLAWAFETHYGGQNRYNKNGIYYSWAVRDGDVVTTPIPAAAWLFGSALLGLAGLKRRAK